MVTVLMVLELIGAVIGAGLASGREIASFFAIHGRWCAAGVAAAGLTIMAVGSGGMLRHRQLLRLYEVLQVLLVIVTAGAMLSAAGHAAALLMPVHGAYWLGLAFAMLISCALAKGDGRGFAAVSLLMCACLAAELLGGCVTLPVTEGVLVRSGGGLPGALLMGVAYGGFNAVLMQPVHAASGVPAPLCRRATVLAAAGLTAILSAGCLVLMKHPGLLTEPMPLVRLMNRWGRAGFLLAACSISLSAITTLTACMKGMKKPWQRVLIVPVALMGFEEAVSMLYPALGLAGALLLGGAKIMKKWNSFR